MLLRIVPFLFLSALTIAEEVEYSAGSYDPLGAHGGIFRALPWTEKELRHISALHATAEYHRLLPIIKEKLLDYGSELDPHTRRQIENFLVQKRPPKVFQELLSDDERHQIRKFHQFEDVDSALAVVRAGLERLPEDKLKKALDYLQVPNTPGASQQM
ncbi:unnamed protein product, partial [Mesorhabditis spiculigera]